MEKITKDSRIYHNLSYSGIGFPTSCLMTLFWFLSFSLISQLSFKYITKAKQKKKKDICKAKL